MMAETDCAIDDSRGQLIRRLSLSIRRAGMDLLARREHCRGELIDKLTAKFANTRLTDQNPFGRTPVCPPDGGDSPSGNNSADHAPAGITAEVAFALSPELSPQLSPETIADLVQTEVDRLAGENLQSDQRFVESFINGRKQQGKGPLRIRQELQQKQVDAELVADYLQVQEGEWYALAASVYRKKYGSKPVGSYQEKAKRSRFMAYRGFSSSHIQALMD